MLSSDLSPSSLPTRTLSLIRLREMLIKVILHGCTLFSLLITFAIITLLAVETLRFFRMEEVGFWDFLAGTKWNPLLGATKNFGVWPLVTGTLLITVIAMLVALPMGLVTAIFLSEFASPGLRNGLKPALEILAGIPTVAYGFFALTFITPSLIQIHDGFDFYNALSAGIAVGILCLPTVVSLSEDALQAVPLGLRASAYGLGATKYEVAMKVTVPAALSGIVSAFLLAFARAVGETMIVALAAGSRPQITLDPRNEIQTMTGYITQVAKGDVNNFGVEYYSIYAVAAVLFLMTFGLNVLGHLIRKRFRETYE